MIFAVAPWQVPLKLLKTDEMVANSTLMTQLKNNINRVVDFVINEEGEIYDVLQLLDDSSDDLGEDFNVDDLKNLLTVAQIAELQAYLKQVYEIELNDSMAYIGRVIIVDEDPCDDPINVN